MKRFSPFHFAKDMQTILYNTHAKSLKACIKTGLLFLKSNTCYRKSPWYVLIGDKWSGKTTLLGSLSPKPITTSTKPLAHISPTTYCQWLYGSHAIFMDTASGLMMPECPNTASLKYFQYFVKQLKHPDYARPVKGVIIAISLTHFQEKSQTARTQYLQVLKHHIQAFPYPIPIHMVLTRCDALWGFSEFFAHCMAKDQALCGLTLNPCDLLSFEDHLETQLHAFLVRINQQLIPYLHQETDLKKRCLMKNFPLQLEAHKQNIADIANHLHDHLHPLLGIYLTSSRQSHKKQDALWPVRDRFGFPKPMIETDAGVKKTPFFIQKTLQHIVQTRCPWQTPKKTRKSQRRLCYLLATLLVSGFAFLTLSYCTAHRTLVTLEKTLKSQKTALSSQEPLQILNAFNQLTHPVGPVWANWLFPQTHHLIQQLATNYHHALSRFFRAFFDKTLLQQLNTGIQNPSADLYNTLKLYLMLGNLKHQNTAWILFWFRTYLGTHTHYSPAEQTLWCMHLEKWLGTRSTALPQDQARIAAARAALKQVDPTQIAYHNLSVDDQMRHKDPAHLYAATAFGDIYHKSILHSVQQTLQENTWVLQESLPKPLVASILNVMVQAVQNQYVSNYGAFWQAKLQALTLPHFNNLQVAQKFAESFFTPNNPLLTSLHHIQHNLSPIAQTPVGQSLLVQIKHIEQDCMQGPQNSDIVDALHAFDSYLQTLQTAKNKANKLSAATQARMQSSQKDAIDHLIQASEQARAPIKDWLQQLALQTWRIMLTRYSEQLDKRWQAEVLPGYRQKIKGRYPVFSQGSSHIALPDFVAFFGEQGILSRFFKHNLKVFVDTSHLYWKLKIRNHQQLPISKTALEMLNRAAIIRRMFFDPKQGNMTRTFFITPVHSGALSASCVLNLQGKTLYNTPGLQNPYKITWGIQTPLQKATLSVQTHNQTRTIIAKTGDWALFQLFAQGTLKVTQNPSIYTLTFTIDGNKVHYRLQADAPINLFTPHILSDFKCVPSLKS